MTETLLQTKLYIPPLRPNLVPRPQLIEQLNQGLELGNKLSLISAPACFGKSTLAGEWVAGCGRPAAWLSLDQGDSDPTRFLTYLVAALQRIEPEIGEGVLELLQSPQPSSPDSILTTLLNEIMAVPDPFILILDDYHVIDAKAVDVSTSVDGALTFLLDHLRAALVILVVLHHIAIVYREGVSFWYVDPPKGESLGGFILVLFVLFNQAWFMGALFLIAGYFTPGSFDRKGSGSFLKGRLIRIGIPLLGWIFVLNPISNIGLYLGPVYWITDPLTWQNFWQMYPEFIGLGIAWFLALLLIFSFGYAAWRWLTRNRPPSSTGESSPPSYLGIGIFILGLALLTYLVRIIVPIGRSVLDFPTIAYLPQYLSFFIIGTIAYRRDWFRTIPNRMGKVGFATAMVVTLLLFPIPILGLLGGTMRFLGNGSWPSAVYAFWDSAFAVGMCLASITFFRRFFNEKSRLGSFLAQQSYAVYIIHSPIIVFLAYLLYLAYVQVGIDPGPLLKFGIATVIVVPICYAVAYLLRKIPGVSKFL